MRVLFLENNDSFSWNVIDALPVERHEIAVIPGNPAQAVGHQDNVVAGHQTAFSCHPGQGSLRLGGETRRAGVQQEHIGTDLPNALDKFDCLVIGPGPTDPIRAGIVEIVRQAAEIKLPTLGICLGHQAIGLAFGARLIRTHPVHGKRSEVVFSQSRLFPNTLGTHTVMRYHSLSLSDVKSPLRVVAQTGDGIPMAIEHESLPIAGLQFHPDSYASPTGRAMLADFFEAIR
jgi:anthranilate synthase/aminodeoxychorismate synthase-like glutamine amidotransferase